MLDIVVIIPALNEEKAIAKVLAHIPWKIVREVVVVDNNSCDDTAAVAKNFGATVIHENRRGYGSACLKGIEYIMSTSRKTDIVVFLDADYSDYPEEMASLIQPIVQQNYDLVIGSRFLGQRQKGAMPWQQVLGNRLSVGLINTLYGVRYTDLGPFRAVKFDKLLELDMQEKKFGWTAEMQARAARQKLRYCEVPVSYRARTGTSKISGTLRGTVCAGYGILTAALKNRWA
jgi:glycosyltransferase involved in cell wall biosynthesis